jgi:hypothetical protein
MSASLVVTTSLGYACPSVISCSALLLFNIQETVSGIQSAWSLDVGVVSSFSSALYRWHWFIDTTPFFYGYAVLLFQASIDPL